VNHRIDQRLAADSLDTRIERTEELLAQAHPASFIPDIGLAISSSASGATTSLTAMPGAHPLLHVFPRQSRGRMLQKVRFSARKFLFLPVVNRHCIGRARKVIPQILYQLKLLRRAQFKDRRSHMADSTLRHLFSQKQGLLGWKADSTTPDTPVCGLSLTHPTPRTYAPAPLPGEWPFPSVPRH